MLPPRPYGDDHVYQNTLPTPSTRRRNAMARYICSSLLAMPRGVSWR